MQTGRRALNLFIKTNQILLIAINLILIACTVFRPEIFFLVATICVWIDLLAYCFSNISKRVFLFVFLIAFFVFLLGREILDVFNLHTVISRFSTEINIHAERLLLISLLCIIIGYCASGHIKFASSRDRNVEYDTPMILSIRKVSSILFFFSFLFSIIQLLSIGRYILSHGYLSTYISFTSSLPYFFTKIADMTPVSFWLFLSTFPTKKEVDRHAVFFVIYLAMTLLTGRRFAFVAGLLVLFTYYSLRDNIKNEGTKWIKRSTIIICILAVPIGAVALYYFSRMRFGNVIEGTSLGDAFTDFFYSQGVSINVIKYAKMYDINPEKNYMFSSTLTFLQKNIIARFLGVHSYSGNTVENATNGHSLAHAMSYLLYGDRYLNGRGIGSCYIAEAFHDFGYFGVVIVNLIYGVILNKFFDFRRKGVFTGTISLILLNSLLYAPRGSTDGFVADIVDFTSWGTIITVYILSYLISKRVSRTTETVIEK